ncbi:oligosaccharide flippase family protein [Pseudomonas guariconensis]|uniref:oligosaccharide flippase family protein n=1 Tax=Pseudomonas guariconensis TaxID=1288410 RepID=UPI0018AB47E3|nr:oligosaccharide flippase family protein [Pseudomonas guariconensis]MBF8731383.1 oligosaccharide flippase family protein [Pseudomonas guariconensis]
MKPGMAISTFRTATGQFFGLLFGAAAVKLLAVLAGPAGVGLYSVLRQLQQMLSSVASVGGQNAVVQGMSSHTGAARQRFFLSTLYVFLAMSLFMCGVVLFGADLIAKWVLAGAHASAVRWLMIPIALGTLLFFLRGVLTADMQYGSVAAINLLTGVGAAVVALPAGLAFTHGYPDLLVLLVGGGLVPALAVAFIHVRRLGYFGSLRELTPRGASWTATTRFLRVALPSLLSLILTMGCVLIVRARAVHLYGLEGAGQFDAAWSISAMYLALFLTSLQSYLLPELSKAAKGTALYSALSKAFHFALMLSLPLVVGLVVFKPLVMHLLFSKAFLPALDVLRWVLLGDFVRVLGWIMSTTLMAKADMKGYALAEGLWSMVFVSVAWVLLPHGIEWVGVAYLSGYVMYLICHGWRLWLVHGVRLELQRIGQWFAALALIILTSWLCWDVQSLFSWPMLMIIPPMLFSWIIMKADERQFALHLATQSLRWLKRFIGRR